MTKLKVVNEFSGFSYEACVGKFEKKISHYE